MLVEKHTREEANGFCARAECVASERAASLCSFHPPNTCSEPQGWTSWAALDCTQISDLLPSFQMVRLQVSEFWALLTRCSC